MKGKVLIVDDEPLIRRGLMKMIAASQTGWSVAGEADNGMEAMALIEELRPDLVITDIRMPEMDGVELCRHISELERPIDVMVLTAYKDFEFAQAALRYGAIDFLLKPLSAEELTKPLAKAFKLFTERQEELVRSLAEQNRLLEHTLRAWLLGLPLEEAAVRRLRRTCEGRALLVFTVDSYTPAGKDYRREDARLLQFAVLNVMQELFAQAGGEGTIVSVKHDVFAVAAAGAAAELDAYAGQATGMAHALLGLTLRSERVDSASFAALYGCLAGSPQDAAQSKHDPLVPDHAERSKSIQAEAVAYIVQGQIELLRSYWEGLIAAAAAMTPSDAKLEGLAIALAMEAARKRVLEPSADGSPAGHAEDPGLGVWIEALQPLREAQEVAHWLRAQAQAFMYQLNSWLAGKNDKLLDKAVRYIEQHYKGDCSIHDVAQHVHLSVSYFSNLFKKETGESYTNYLTKFRLEKAKILLSNTNMKISEIAEAVGYDDPNYFTTVFRNWVRCSPSEFRRMG
ncbi:response regulator [Paenibacillus whitsoniae]|uniref:Response regulator n=1 Tax=Paenibacillus whitsoniae TaxID=2496558 RepID=A0A430JHW5_9BACL|nr:response regulator [Paenibacillus whitsoniae]RTE10615.1 response regulator [Paenibacillus whitsoniae]